MPTFPDRSADSQREIVWKEYAPAGMGVMRNDSSHDAAVVFVHGWDGHFRTTWTHRAGWLQRIFIRAPETSLLELLVSDPDVAVDCFSVAHHAGPISAVEVETIAGLVITFLDNYVQARHVILVAHSLGGLACRRAIVRLLQMRPADADRIVGLLLYGTPNNGTELSRAGRILRSASAAQMRPLCGFLEDLNRDWTEHVINGGNPDLDPVKRGDLTCKTVVGERDKIVSPTSAASLFHLGDVETVAKGHIALPKARSHEDPSYVVLKRFVRATLDRALTRPLSRASTILAYNARRSICDAESRGHAWTMTEHEEIELREPNVPGNVDGLLACRIKCVLTGGPRQSILRICFSLEPHQPSVAVDYHHVIGRGLLPSQDFLRLAEMLRARPNETADGDEPLRVHVPRLRTAGGTLDYTYSLPLSSISEGCVVLAYESPPGVAVNETDAIEIDLNGLVTARHGWYGYFAPRTVVARLAVELKAPFPLVVVDLPDWSNPDVEEGETGVQRFRSAVDLRGPIAKGAEIRWLFNRKDE